MTRIPLLSLTICIAVLGCGQAPEQAAPTAASDVASASEIAPGADPAEVVEARHDVVYVCNCGPGCACGVVSKTPGTCTCGKELVWAHVVKVEGSDALLCTCSEGCTCTIDANDATKCTCGNDLRRVSLAGTGLYFCNCGGSCTCNHIAAEPGTCGCGMELINA